MNIINRAITGDDYSCPNEINEEIYNTLYNFYKAFNAKDFILMKENWLHSDEIAMSNPLGGIKHEWDDIQSVYEKIFAGKAKIYVEFYDYTIIELVGGFCCVGRERGSAEVDGKKIELAIRTSRVYKLTQEENVVRYKQVHHHGSIENPELLDAYQKLLS